MKLDLVLALSGTISLDESLRMLNASTTAEGNRHGDRLVGCFVLATSSATLIRYKFRSL